VRPWRTLVDLLRVDGALARTIVLVALATARLV
jgi:hypothetical protein